jgi:hypothetical protein
VIAKHIAREHKASSYQKLVAYIRDIKNNGRKVLAEWSTNCLAKTLELCEREIVATQAMNNRTQVNKTYHLVLSFHPEDQLTQAVMADIENAVCSAIGLGEHQRIVVMHNDTDHLHMHLAINKVHPQTFKVHTPYLDYLALDKACDLLEQRHQLRADTRIYRHREQAQTQDVARSRKVEGAIQYESRTGYQSYQAWLGDSVVPQLKELLSKEATTWQEVHTLLAMHGTELRLRGNGLVFSHATEQFFLKASSLDRTFSRAKLENKCGNYIPAAPSADVPLAVYRPNQAYAGDGARLHTKFRNMITTEKLQFKELQNQRRKTYAEQRTALRSSYRDRRRAIGKGATSRSEKRKLSSLLSIEYVVQLEKLREAISKQFAQPNCQNRRDHWLDFLKQEVMNGNVEARQFLQREGVAIFSKVEGRITGVLQNEAILFRNYRYTVHRNGDITYQLGQGASFIDRGKTIELPSADRASVESALVFALQRYGTKLEIAGSEEFKATVARVLEVKQLKAQVSWNSAGEKLTQSRSGGRAKNR